MSSSVQWHPFPYPPNLSTNHFYFGTSGYHFDDWIGKFNPPKHHLDPDAKDRLRFYLRYFDFIEINQTFYREIDPSWFNGFLDRCNQNTQITVKVHRDISHNWRWDLDVAKTLMDRHVIAVSEGLRSNRFFSFLIQLEDRVAYSPKRLKYLLGVSQVALLAGLDVHIEFRNISWHQLDILQELKDLNNGICNTEIPPIDQSIFPLKSYATSSKGYVRYSGRNIANWRQDARKPKTRKEQILARNNRYDYRYSENELKARTTGQIALRQKTDCVAVAFNNHYEAAAVENAISNMKMIDEMLNKEEDKEALLV